MYGKKKSTELCSYIVSEVWESYPLEFVIILFEDSGFLIDFNYSLLNCIPIDWCKNKSSNKC